VAIGIVTAGRPMATAAQLVQAAATPAAAGCPATPISWLVAVTAGAHTHVADASPGPRSASLSPYTLLRDPAPGIEADTLTVPFG
jgi:hypothetical protein